MVTEMLHAGMAAAAPPAPPQPAGMDPHAIGTWMRVEVETAEDGVTHQPCQRSLHVAAVLKDKLLIFGGYNGAER